MKDIKQGSRLYEGKAKKVYAVETRADDGDELVIIHYKDDATAFNGEKKGQIEDKGVMNNKIAPQLSAVRPTAPLLYQSCVRK
ncbi:hypothetical protein FACS189483_11530 [Spirochaetia bacterium]|nr:hypothetical protein FACS189483_11530 [Spirochaetia bacterium]